MVEKKPHIVKQSQKKQRKIAKIVLATIFVTILLQLKKCCKTILLYINIKRTRISVAIEPTKRTLRLQQTQQ